MTGCSDDTFIYTKTILVVDMALGEKLFEDIGNLTKLDVKSVHPVEGVKTEVSFTSEIKGLSKFPSGKLSKDNFYVLDLYHL